MKLKVKLFVFLALIAVVLSLFIGLADCSDEKELRIYCWEDYIAPQLITKFEKQFNCKVKVDVFPSNEAMYAKLNTGISGYDLVVPSSYMAKLMNEQKMLETLDLSLLPNFVKFYDSKYNVLCTDREHKYSIPYLISFTGIGYHAGKVKDFTPSWRMFERTDLKGKMSLLDDHREAIGCALKTLGFNANSIKKEEVDQAVSLLRKWKENIAKFGVDDSCMSLAQGDFYLIQAYSGDMLQYAVDNPDIRFVIPEEGGTVTFDNFAIMKNSRSKDLAYKFIDFIYESENSAENMSTIYYRMAHKQAIKSVVPEIRNNPVFNIPDTVFAKCNALEDLGEHKELYTRAWDMVKK